MGRVGNRKEYEPVLLLHSSRLILETLKGRIEQRASEMENYGLQSLSLQILKCRE